MRCAVVNNEGLVLNVIVADPSDPAPEGCILVEVPDDLPVDQSCTWDGSAFTLPAPQPGEHLA